MRLNEVVRAAIERRILGVERALGAVEGVVVQRVGDRIFLHGRRLIRRSVNDLRLRFAGLER